MFAIYLKVSLYTFKKAFGTYRHFIFHYLLLIAISIFSKKFPLVTLELTTPAFLTSTVYKYRALTNCATEEMPSENILLIFSSLKLYLFSFVCGVLCGATG